MTREGCHFINARFACAPLRSGRRHAVCSGRSLVNAIIRPRPALPAKRVRTASSPIKCTFTCVSCPPTPPPPSPPSLPPRPAVHRTSCPRARSGDICVRRARERLRYGSLSANLSVSGTLGHEYAKFDRDFCRFFFFSMIV